MPATIMEKSGLIDKNVTYYNKIAIEYDDILDRESSNEIVRDKVRQKFTGLVKCGTVLDFGGGTGRDLNWLLSTGYQVIFCEPSQEMRRKAIELYRDNQAVTFLKNDEVDFAGWGSSVPFTEKADAILSDFAVLNCISDLELLFKNLAQVIKPGGHMVALMLQHGYQKTWLWKLKKKIRNFITRKALAISTSFEGQQQMVYVYLPHEVKSASSVYFDTISQDNLYEFTMFHLVRK